MFETFLGLPLHPLAVHAAAVLLPLASAGTVALAAVPAWRRTYGPLAVLAAVAATAAVGAATLSGHWLRAELGFPPDRPHARLGATLVWYALGQLAATSLLVGLHRRGAGRGLLAVVAAVAVATSVAATAQVVRVGHSGAASVWEGRVPAAR